jgi:hypothetical protein
LSHILFGDCERSGSGGGDRGGESEGCGRLGVEWDNGCGIAIIKGGILIEVVILVLTVMVVAWVRIVVETVEGKWGVWIVVVGVEILVLGLNLIFILSSS